MPLVDELEKVVGAFHCDDLPTYRALYPNGWIKAMAVSEGLLLCLLREKQLGLLDKETRFAGRPPLDIVLRPLLSLRYPTQTQCVQVVTMFLDFGMDPNQHHEHSTVWALFLEYLCQRKYAESGFLPHELGEIFEKLLAAGADPDLCGDCKKASKHFKPEDVEHLEKIILRMQAQKHRANSKIVVSSDLSESQTSAQPSRKRDFSRVAKWLTIRH